MKDGPGGVQSSQASMMPSPSVSGWHSSGTPLESQSSDVPTSMSQASPADWAGSRPGSGRAAGSCRRCRSRRRRRRQAGTRRARHSSRNLRTRRRCRRRRPRRWAGSRSSRIGQQRAVVAGVDDTVAVGVGLAFVGHAVGVAVLGRAHVDVAGVTHTLGWQSAWFGLGSGQLSQMSITPSPSASGWHSSGTPLSRSLRTGRRRRRRRRRRWAGSRSVSGLGTSGQLSQAMMTPSPSVSGWHSSGTPLESESSLVPSAMSSGSRIPLPCSRRGCPGSPRRPPECRPGIACTFEPSTLAT